VALGLIAPSFVGWHHDDDLQNMRWAMEYRDAPWQALTGRHSLHDHIRPATLWATWLGAHLSNGDWWGPHAVMSGLLLGGWIAMALLVSRLVKSPLAGFLTAVIILDMEGFRLLLDWDSWINTAGEICFGLLGLILVWRGFGRSCAARVMHLHLLGALACITMAGWFKEPGWVVYPCVASLMALLAFRRGAGRAAAFWAAGLLAAGLLGFLWSHTTANVDRLGSLDVMGKLNDLKHAMRAWVDSWPSGDENSRKWRGVALPLLALAISGAMVLRRSETASPAQGRIIILGTVSLTILGYAREDMVGIIVGLSLVGMLFVHRSGLIAALGILTAGVMFLFPGPNPVQLLMAAMAFAALIAIHSSRMLDRHNPFELRVFAGIIVVLGLGLEALQVGQRLLSPEASVRDVPSQLADRDQLLADAALIAGLGGPLAFQKGDLGPRMIGSVYGLRVLPYNPEFAPFRMQISDDTWVLADHSAAASLLLESNLLQLGSADDDGLMHLRLEPGGYAVGLLSRAEQEGAFVRMKTSCDTEVVVRALPGSSPWQVATIHLDEGCTVAEIQARAVPGAEVEAFCLAALPSVQADFRSAVVMEPKLGLPPVHPVPEKH